MCGFEGKNYAIHLDFTFTGSRKVRLSVSNIYKEEKYDHFSIQVPLPLPANKWVVVCLDVKGCFDRYHCMKEEEKYYLKAVTVCANIKILRIAIADKVFNSETLPRDLNYKLHKNEDWNEKYVWIEPIPCEHLPEPEVAQVEKKKQPKPSKVAKATTVTSSKSKQEIIPAKTISRENFPVNIPITAKIERSLPTIKPDTSPILALQDVIGCSLNQCARLFWSKNPSKKELLYAAGNLIVVSDLEGKKRFYTGHTKAVIALDLSHKGDMIASADESIIKIWSFTTSRCMGSWKLEDGTRVKCLGISPDSAYLVSVAKNLHNQDVVTVWNLNTLSKINSNQPHPTIVATQISKTNILYSKFAPPDASDSTLQFCTCGQENIRFWRVKNGVLRSGLVVLDRSVRNTVFTSIDYEGRRRVYVGSKDGNVLQINAESQELEFVYKLHDSGIHAIAVNEGFCATGSDDQYLRVWPLDFSEFFMEAKHEGTVLALDISMDGVMVICGTEGGSIGLLDLSQQKYKTVSRAHTNSIVWLALGKEILLSIARDKTIRLWDLATMQQAYEFSSFDDQALCASLYTDKQLFACGFESGCLRIFDIERTAVIGEYRMFDKPLINMKYLNDYLLTLASDGSIAIHNAGTYDAVKQILAESIVPFPTLPVCEKTGLFVSIGKASSINIWNISSLEIMKNIPLHGLKIQDMAFLNEKTVVILASDSWLRAYALDGTPIFKRQVIGLSSGQAKMIISNNGKYIAFIGSDQIVRVTPLPITSQTNGPIELKEYEYHTNKVNSGLFHPTDPTLFFSAGGMEGILVWRFNGRIADETEPLTMRDDVAIREIPDRLIEISPELSTAVSIDLEAKAVIMKLNRRTAKRSELHLPLKHYVSDHEEKQIFYEDISTQTLIVEDKNIHIQKTLGYNGNSHDNLCYSSTHDWIAFTLNHKLIVEEFASKRQEVYLDQEAEISTIAISYDLKYLATATGIPNRTTNIADIVVYSIGSKPYLQLLKKLCFYQKGVQVLQFSMNQPGKLWSVGRYPENTLALWDIATGACLATEVLSEPIHSLCQFHKFDWIYGLSINHITLIRDEHNNGKLAIDKIIKEDMEFTCARQVEEVILIGGTNGNIMVYDPVNSEMLKERRVSSSEITCIEYNKGVILASGGDTVYIWKKALSWHAIEQRPIEVKLNASIVALISKSSTEFFIGTSDDSLYLLSMLPNGDSVAMKLHSSHSDVTAMCVPEDPGLLISAGTDNTVKVFAKENCDLLAEYNFPGEGACCNSLIAVCGLFIGCFNDGCLRFWSLQTLKQIGRAQVSSSSLTAMSTNGLVVFIGNEAGAIFVLNFVSLEPVIANIQKIESELEGAITAIDSTCPPFVIIASSKGDIITWEVIGDLGLKSIPERCGLAVKDKWNLFENPHGIEVSQEDLMIYKEKKRHKLTAMVYKDNPMFAICGCDSLQYLYVRNVKNHIIERRVVIDIFPMCISLLQLRGWLCVGGADGTVKLKNIENSQEENVRAQYSSVIAMEVFPDSITVVTGGRGEISKWAIELDN